MEIPPVEAVSPARAAGARPTPRGVSTPKMLFRLLTSLAFLALLSAQQDIPADEFQLTGSIYSPPSQIRLNVETRLVEPSSNRYT